MDRAVVVVVGAAVVLDVSVGGVVLDSIHYNTFIRECQGLVRFDCRRGVIARASHKDPRIHDKPPGY